MAYCGPRGIPHSHFLGGPACWTDDDRDKALAWQELQRQTCSGCGTHPDDVDPAHGGHPDAWGFEPDICRVCELKERAEAALQGDDWKTQRGKRLRRRRRRT